MSWSNLYKLWALATTDDPVSRREKLRNIEGAGVSQPDAIPDIRQDGSMWSGGKSLIRLRDTSDFIDLSSVTNRQSRYKEYERLRMVPEIETALTIFADESCVSAETKIATPTLGYVSIGELAKTKKPDEHFLVYCYDFGRQDFTLGWAHHPRLVKRAETVRIVLEDGESFVCTPEHRVLLRTAEWIEAGSLQDDDELMPFYRQHAEQRKTKLRTNQFARVFTLLDGWKHERMFIDEWRTGKRDKRREYLYHIERMICGGLNTRQIADMEEKSWAAINYFLQYYGFSYPELKMLCKRYPDCRRVISVLPNGEEDVYDLSVNGHENFATDTTIFHNCQLGENGHMFEINVKNEDIRDELEFLFFHPKMLNFDRKLWNVARNLYMFGDHFTELIIDPEQPKDGVIKVQNLPADSIYRIETIKGKLLEFQQSKDGPDYQSLSRVEVTKASQADLAQATAIRFVPESLIHFRIGDDRRTFYPYGVSLIEAARGPAHQLRLMEDAMLVYRLSRSPERRVFYIDVGQLPPFKAEMLIERLKDQLRKRKTFNQRGTVGGAASPVEERWVAPSQDEDFWIPIRPNANTRIETLPGAQNLGEIDDALYFRNKLFIALNFPKSYMAQEDTQVTRVTLSSIDVKFARLVERLQQGLADGLLEIAIRHLELRGYPEEMFEDLQIRMTPPSHWRELSEQEVIEARYNRAMAVKGAGLFADVDVLTRILKIPENEAKQIVARGWIQKLQELKLQVIAQNPELMGIAMPGQTGMEMGTEAGGPNPMLSGAEGQTPPPGGPNPMLSGAEGQTPPPGGPEAGGAPPPGGPEAGGAPPEGTPPETGTPPQTPPAQGKPLVSGQDTFGKAPKPQTRSLAEPSEEDIKKYDLDIMDYSKGQDEEEIDTGELEDF